MRSYINFAYFLLLLLSSCIVVDTRGFYSGYKELTLEQKQNIVFLNDQNSKLPCDASDAKKIYAVTAKQLLNCLKEQDSSIVYFWAPNCHSNNCISLGAAEKYCLENNYKLYIVSEYFDREKVKIQNNDRPLFAINHLYYKTDNCNRYKKLFIKELLHEQNVRSEVKYKRFFVFSKSSFIRAKEMLF